MTRKELIQQEADIRFPDNPVAQSRFKDGAEWADKNPSEANIAMYLGKKGWPLSTCGVPTYEEAARTLDEYYEYKRKQLIERAKKWFEYQNEWRDLDGVRHCDLADFEDFLKTMNL